MTPSSTGVRIIGNADGEKLQRALKQEDGSGWEAYRNCERFITMTGRHLDRSSPDAFNASINSVINRLVAEADEAKKSKPKTNGSGNGVDKSPPQKGASSPSHLQDNNVVPALLP